MKTLHNALAFSCYLKRIQKHKLYWDVCSFLNLPVRGTMSPKYMSEKEEKSFLELWKKVSISGLLE